MTDRRNLAKKTLNEIKKIGCEICGEKCLVCLDFHHNNPEEKEGKKNEISRMIRNDCSLNKILEEVSKCRIVCANCHRKIHFDKSVAD